MNFFIHSNNTRTEDYPPAFIINLLKRATERVLPNNTKKDPFSQSPSNILYTILHQKNYNPQSFHMWWNSHIRGRRWAGQVVDQKGCRIRPFLLWRWIWSVSFSPLSTVYVSSDITTQRNLHKAHVSCSTLDQVWWCCDRNGGSGGPNQSGPWHLSDFSCDLIELRPAGTCATSVGMRAVDVRGDAGDALPGELS